VRKLFLIAIIICSLVFGLLIGFIIDRVSINDDQKKITPSTVRIIMPTPKITENQEEQREKEKEYGKLK
jgi:uncharacterized protein YneF (UPF0154 family)